MSLQNMPPERRKSVLRAIFAKMRENQNYIRGAQRAIKGTDYYVGAAEDVLRKKYPQTRAWLKAGGMITGAPQQIIRAASSVERAADATRKAQLIAETQAKGAELLAKGMPFPALGRGRPGAGQLVPPPHYKKWVGPGAQKGMWFPPDTWDKMHTSVKRGRPPKIKKSHKKKIKEALQAQAKSQQALATPIRRVIEVGKV